MCCKWEVSKGQSCHGGVAENRGQNWAVIQEHENEREKLVIKMEAVIQEKVSLETKLVALKIQVNSLTLEIEEQRAKVKEKTSAHSSSRAIIDYIYLIFTIIGIFYKK